MANTQQSLFSFTERRKLIPVSEIAQLTGLPDSLLRTYARLGLYEFKQAAPGRKIWIDRQSFEAWFRKNSDG